MLRILLLSVVLFTGVNLAAAQPQRRSAEERAQLLTDLQQKKVGLSDDQKAQILEINRKSFTQIDDVRAANAGNRQAMMKAVREINQARDAATLALLTEEQKPKYEAAKEEFRAAMQQRMQGRRGGRR